VVPAGSRISALMSFAAGPCLHRWTSADDRAAHRRSSADRPVAAAAAQERRNPPFVAPAQMDARTARCRSRQAPYFSLYLIELPLT
jgi:hypothetical protein